MNTNHLLVLALLGSGLAAQSNPFVVFPQDPERDTITCASYTRRPGWDREAEAFQEVSVDWLRGVGNLGNGVAEVYGIYHYAVDFDPTTAETYGLILRTADANGAPDVTPAGIIAQVQNLSLPAGGSGVEIMTDFFATPVAVPSDATWFQGLYMPASPNWPGSDGHGLFAADTLAASTPAVVGENARLSAPAVTWVNDLGLAPGGFAYTTEWTYILGAIVLNPVLHIGGIDPNSTRTGGAPGDPSYGMAGLFPDISGAPRSDGLNLRLQDNVQLFGAAVYFGSTGWNGTPVSIPGFAGDVQIDLGALVPLGLDIPMNGVSTIPFITPGALAPSVQGNQLMIQALMLDPMVGGRLSNAQVTDL